MMDTVTIGVLGGMMTVILTVMLTVMIYLDRSRRAEMAELRAELRAGMAELRAEMVSGFDRVEKRFLQMDERFLQLTGMVVGFAEDVGELKGRVAVSVPVEAFSAAE